MSPLRQLHEAGQAVWMDFLRRGLVTSGGLERMIRDDLLAGVTSNPTIFGKAIGGSTDYDEAVRALVDRGTTDRVAIFYDLALEDIRMAADVFRRFYDRTKGWHGLVSFELEARLAHDTRASVEAARDLARRIDRPNVMIKVPGTAEGVPAVEELTAAGVNVNITLLFSVERHEDVARAYIRGLERRLEAGEPVDRIVSVASFFISRVDSAVDRKLPEGHRLRGKIAIANAKRAYQRFLRVFSGERWERLAARGARVQRPLWASTSVKNPDYPELMYVEALVGRDTVDTMPESTLDAFRDHGTVRPDAVLEDVDGAEAMLRRLPAEGVDLDEVTAQLVEDGVRAFDEDFQKLSAKIDEKVEAARAGRTLRAAALPKLETRVGNRLKRIAREDVVTRIWCKDHRVWKPEPTEIVDRLGWLVVPDLMHERVPELEAFAKQAAADGLERAVLLGMGGSSMAPEVLRRTLGVAPGALDLSVLDTTHPAAIARLERELDLSKTLFLVASKSGTTVETLSHLAYFWDRTGHRGAQFAAVTDPGTPLERTARERGFRAVFLNPTDIGGRYSALSLFGLVPAALIGADVHALLDAGEEMACACARHVPISDNPGAWLGAVMGEAARARRDKLTLVASPHLASLGDWIEQLVAESTGKEGAGIVPVVGEDLGEPKVYRRDRLFVAFGEAPPALGAIEDAGHPVVRLLDAGPRTLGAEFFRWEFATAVAGYVLGINPFDQPNVAEAKEATGRILDEGASAEPARDDVRALLGTVKRGDYVAIQAYLDSTPEAVEALQRARLAIRDQKKVATTVGLGPRFLHSTGQLHKGGPDTGVFIQVVDAGRGEDVDVPGKPYTFGRLIDAQALGDLRALRSRGRRVARTTLDDLARALGRRR